MPGPGLGRPGLGGSAAAGPAERSPHLPVSRGEIILAWNFGIVGILDFLVWFGLDKSYGLAVFFGLENKEAGVSLPAFVFGSKLLFWDFRRFSGVWCPSWKTKKFGLVLTRPLKERDQRLGLKGRWSKLGPRKVMFQVNVDPG